MDRTVRSIFEAMRNYGSMNEAVNAVDRIEKSVPVSVLQQKYHAPGLTYKTPFPPEYNDGKEMTWGQKLVADTKEVIRCGDSAAEDKYAPGAFRIRLFDCDCAHMEKRSPEDAAKEQRFGRLFNEMLSDKSVVLDFDFRECVQGKGGIKPKPGSKPWTYDDFESRYGEIVDVAIKQEKEEAAATERTDKGYEVIEIKDFDMAMEFGKYTGGPNSESQLCYTENESTMKGQFGGLVRNRVWLAYKPGFKGIDPVMGEGCPYDEYGLSMIWVFVGPDGDMPYVNVRWNHYAEHKGVRYTRGRKATDHCLSMKDVVDITGHSFEDTFKPYKTEKSEVKIVERLPNGYSKIRRIVSRSGKEIGKEYNICKGEDTTQPVSDGWFFNIYKHNDKYAEIESEPWRYNLFSYETGELVFDEWFRDIMEYNDKYAKIEGEVWRYNLFSYETGELVFDEWFRAIREFTDKYAKIKNEQEQCNLLSYDTDKFLFDEWFDDIGEHNDKCAFARNEQGQWNLLSFETGEVLSDEWFRYTYKFNYKYAEVKNEQGQCNLLSYDTGKFISDEWFRAIIKFNNKYAEVENEQKQWNLLSYDTGKFLSDEWFGFIEKFNDKYARIENEQGHWNLISYDAGGLLSDEWFEEIRDFNDKYALVRKNRSLYNLLSYDTEELVFDEWFEAEYVLKDAARKKGIDKYGTQTHRHESRTTGAKAAVCECCGRRFSVK